MIETISGTAEPGSTVTITNGDKRSVVVEADDQGNWTAELPEVSEGDTITVVAETVGKIQVHQSQLRWMD